MVLALASDMAAAQSVAATARRLAVWGCSWKEEEGGNGWRGRRALLRGLFKGFDVD